MIENIMIIILVIVSVLITFLKYKDYKKRQLVKKCPKCKSKNITNSDFVFLRNEEQYLPEARDPRTLSHNPRIDSMNQKYYKVVDKIYNVQYECLNCNYKFSQELIK